MQKNRANYIKIIFPIFLLFILFAVSSYFAQKYNDFLFSLATSQGNSLGIIFYVIITIVAVIIPPFSSAPLIPVAAGIWGFFGAAIFSIAGWVLGAMAAFLIARVYGVPLVSRITSIERIYEIQKSLSPRHIFWSAVLLRMIMPVDILSYALGLFGLIGWKEYLFATALGVTPFAFAFAYVGTLSVLYQLVILLALAPLIAVWLWRAKR